VDETTYAGLPGRALLGPNISSLTLILLAIKKKKGEAAGRAKLLI